MEITGSITRLNIIDELLLHNIGGTLTGTYDTIDCESILKFKKDHYPLEQKVHIVLDGTAYHKDLSEKGFIPYNETTSKMQHGLVVIYFLFPTDKQPTIVVQPVMVRPTIQR